MPRSSTAKGATPKATTSNTGPTPTPKPRIDWEAVERDYRTDKFTLRELAAKHGVTHTTISRRAEKQRWEKDLTAAIRQATSAKLIEATVQQKSASAHQNATDAVLGAAELNKQVILAHREDIKGARDVALGLLGELANAALLAQDMELLAQILAGSGATPQDENQARQAVQRALSVTSRIGGIKGLAEAFTKLQTAERKAFAIDDDGAPDENPLAALLSAMGKSALPVVKATNG